MAAPRKPSFPRRRTPMPGTDQLPMLDEQLHPVIAPESAVFNEPPELNDLTPEAPQPESGEMARLTEVPTKTTNRARPRTLAAGYDQPTRTLSVIFRDGTPWNYYDVTPLEAANFRRANSKGRFIRLYLDGRRNGPPADDGVHFSQRPVPPMPPGRAG